MSRTGWPVRASVPLRSTSDALPPATSIVVTDWFTSASDAGARPSWPRQRLTLPIKPPPSPAELLTLTAAVPPPSPVSMNLATRNCPPETSCQPDGTCQFGFPSLEIGVAAGDAPMPMSPTDGCDAGKAVGVGAATKFND